MNSKITNSEELSIYEVSKLSHRSLLRIASVACLSVMLFAGVFTTGDTMSYYLDAQTSPSNFFMRGDPVDFTVALNTTQVVLDGSDQMVVPVVTPGNDSEPIQYMVSAHMSAGDSALCNAIQLLGTAPFIYDAPLLSLNTATSSQTGPWAMTFSLQSGAHFASNTSCTIDIIYKAWSVYAITGQGYSDTQKLSLTFITLAAPPPPVQQKAPSDTPEDPSATTTPETAAPETPPAQQVQTVVQDETASSSETLLAATPVQDPPPESTVQ